MKIEVSGYIRNKQLFISNRKRLQQDINLSKDQDVLITIKTKGKRSSLQNAYYWSCVVDEIRLRLKELGNDFDAETVHEYLKQRFNAEKVVTKQGELLEIGQTTTRMNKSEFSEYVDRITQWASESLDLVIQPPNTQTEMPFIMAAEYDKETRSTIVKKAS